jgi:hypothetical protein
MNYGSFNHDPLRPYDKYFKGDQSGALSELSLGCMRQKRILNIINKICGERQHYGPSINKQNEIIENSQSAVYCKLLNHCNRGRVFVGPDGPDEKRKCWEQIIKTYGSEKRCDKFTRYAKITRILNNEIIYVNEIACFYRYGSFPLFKYMKEYGVDIMRDLLPHSTLKYLKKVWKKLYDFIDQKFLPRRRRMPIIKHQLVQDILSFMKHEYYTSMIKQATSEAMISVNLNSTEYTIMDCVVSNDTNLNDTNKSIYSISNKRRRTSPIAISIPQDIMFCVFDYLTANELWKWARVCKIMYIWTQIHYTDFIPITNNSVCHLSELILKRPMRIRIGKKNERKRPLNSVLDKVFKNEKTRNAIKEMKMWLKYRPNVSQPLGHYQNYFSNEKRNFVFRRLKKIILLCEFRNTIKFKDDNDWHGDEYIKSLCRIVSSMVGKKSEDLELNIGFDDNKCSRTYLHMLIVTIGYKRK